MLVVKI